jgi:small GTP-binding protein
MMISAGAGAGADEQRIAREMFSMRLHQVQDLDSGHVLAPVSQRAGVLQIAVQCRIDCSERDDQNSYKKFVAPEHRVNFTIPMRTPSNFEPKFVLIGSQAVGKTAILTRLVNNSFAENTESTISSAFQKFDFPYEGSEVPVQVWDTAGQERYRSLAPLHFRGAHGAIAVYDVTSLESFEDLEEWIDRFQEATSTDTDIILVGNKSDLADSRMVDAKTAKEFAADRGFMFSEASAESGANVDEVLEMLVHACMRRRHAEFRGEAGQLVPQQASGCC